MARLIVLVLVLSLALAPAVEAATPGRAAPPAQGWQDSLRSVWDWLFSWLPALRPASGRSSAWVTPDGFIGGPPPRARTPDGLTGGPPRLSSAIKRGGAMIIPDGLAGGPPARKGGSLPTPARWYSPEQSIR